MPSDCVCVWLHAGGSWRATLGSVPSFPWPVGGGARDGQPGPSGQPGLHLHVRLPWWQQPSLQRTQLTENVGKRDGFAVPWSFL